MQARAKNPCLLPRFLSRSPLSLPALQAWPCLCFEDFKNRHLPNRPPCTLFITAVFPPPKRQYFPGHTLSSGNNCMRAHFHASTPAFQYARKPGRRRAVARRGQHWCCFFSRFSGRGLAERFFVAKSPRRQRSDGDSENLWSGFSRTPERRRVCLRACRGACRKTEGDTHAAGTSVPRARDRQRAAAAPVAAASLSAPLIAASERCAIVTEGSAWAIGGTSRGRTEIAGRGTSRSRGWAAADLGSRSRVAVSGRGRSELSVYNLFTICLLGSTI